MRKKNKQLTEADLLDLKSKLEENKNKLAELRGRKKGLLTELEEKWDCSSVEEAEKKIESLANKANKYERSIKKGTQKLMQDYPDLL